MTPGEVALLLGEAATLERSRPPDEDTLTAWVAAWHPHLAHVAFEDAWAAMTEHYSESSMRLMPADILRRTAEHREQWLWSHPGGEPMPPGWGAAAEIPPHVARQRALAIGSS